MELGLIQGVLEVVYRRERVRKVLEQTKHLRGP